MSHLSFIPAEFKLDRRATFDILVPAANFTSALIEHTIWDVAAGEQREREGRRAREKERKRGRAKREKFGMLASPLSKPRRHIFCRLSPCISTLLNNHVHTR